jgi:hypothetical protein
VALGEEPPAQHTARGKERAKGHQPMEYTDWSVQSITTLIVGIILTAALFAAAIITFIKGEQ